MNYDDIFLFVKLINIGSFSGLAKTLNTTQGTVSRRIQNLEEHLHLQLIRRNSRGLLEMTPDGEILYARFSEQENILNNALEDVIDRQSSIKGKLKVAIPLLLYNKVLAPYIHNFQDSYPDAKLIISYAGGSVDLLKDNIDIAISTCQPSSQTAKIKLLNSYRYRLYATDEYILKNGQPTTPEDLPRHNLVGSAVDNVPDKRLESTNINNNSTQIIDYDPGIYISNAFYNIDMVYSGNYIIKALDLFMSNDVASGKVKVILPEYTFGTSKFYLVRNSGIKSKLERVFVEFMEECFAKCSNNL